MGLPLQHLGWAYLLHRFVPFTLYICLFVVHASAESLQGVKLFLRALSPPLDMTRTLNSSVLPAIEEPLAWFLFQLMVVLVRISFYIGNLIDVFKSLSTLPLSSA